MRIASGFVAIFQPHYVATLIASVIDVLAWHCGMFGIQANHFPHPLCGPQFEFNLRCRHVDKKPEIWLNVFVSPYWFTIMCLGTMSADWGCGRWL